MEDHGHPVIVLYYGKVIQQARLILDVLPYLQIYRYLCSTLRDYGKAYEYYHIN